MITAIDHHWYVEASEIVIKSTFLPGYYNGDVKSKNKSDWNKFCETMAVQRYLLKFLLEDLSDWTSFNFYWTIQRSSNFHSSTQVLWNLTLRARTERNPQSHANSYIYWISIFTEISRIPFSNIPVHFHSGRDGKWGRECSRQWGREVDFATPKNHNSFLQLFLLPPSLTNL